MYNALLYNVHFIRVQLQYTAVHFTRVQCNVVHFTINTDVYCTIHCCVMCALLTSCREWAMAPILTPPNESIATAESPVEKLEKACDIAMAIGWFEVVPLLPAAGNVEPKQADLSTNSTAGTQTDGHISYYYYCTNTNLLI